MLLWCIQKTGWNEERWLFITSPMKTWTVPCGASMLVERPRANVLLACARCARESSELRARSGTRERVSAISSSSMMGSSSVAPPRRTLRSPSQ